MNLRPLHSIHYAMLYPQNGDRTLTLDFVTSLHAVYSYANTIFILAASSINVDGDCP